MFVGAVSVLPLAGGGTREISGAAFAATSPRTARASASSRWSGRAGSSSSGPQGEVLLKPSSILRNPRIHRGQVAFFRSSPAAFADGEIQVLAKGGRPRSLGRYKGFTSLAWEPDGEEIWFSTFDGGESQIQAVSLQGKTRLLARHPGRLELVDVDAGGRCLTISSSQLRQAFGRAPGVDREVDLTWLDAQTPTALKEDGSQVLLTRSGDWEMGPLRPYRPLPEVALRWTSDPRRDGQRDGGPQPGRPMGRDARGRWKGQAGLRLIPTGAGASRWFPLTGAPRTRTVSGSIRGGMADTSSTRMPTA